MMRSKQAQEQKHDHSDSSSVIQHLATSQEVTPPLHYPSIDLLAALSVLIQQTMINKCKTTCIKSRRAI